MTRQLKYFQALAVVCLLQCLVVLNCGNAQESTSKPRVYLIGNSLTWDCVPAALGVDAQWHVDCGKNLKQIFDAPQKPCVPSSSIWTKALKENKYDYLCIQPHYGTRLEDDVQLISRWVAMQPQATLILHSGWAKHVDLEKEYQPTTTDAEATNPAGPAMLHSIAYLDRLQERLTELHPAIKIRRTRMIEALHQIRQDIQIGKAPFTNIRELYRDDIHLTFTGGRYLAHNLLRETLGLPISSQGFQLDSEVKTYLETTISRFREAQKGMEVTN